MSATWVKLTNHSSGNPLFVNMEHVTGLWPVSYVDGKFGWTELRIGGEVWSVKETPEQIFAAMQSNAIYPWASLPGSVHVCQPQPAAPSSS